MIWGYNENEKVSAEPNKTAKCSYCNEELIPKCGSIKIWHWAHKRGNECDKWREPETEWHLEWKNQFPGNCQEVIIEKQGVKHIADIKTNDGKVIELQNSNISSENIAERERFYGNMIWIINGNTIGKNIFVKNKERYATFKWKFPPKSWWVSEKPIFVDFRKNVEKMKGLVKKYENREKTHTSPVYEYYEFYNQELEEEMTGKKIVDYVDDTEEEIEKLRKKINLLENNILQIKRLYKKTPCAGWGFLINKNNFINIYK